MFHSVGQAKVTAEEIKEFGQKYDPQPFHLDEAAGEGSFFKGLAASGWLTAAIVMRLRVQSITVAGRHDRRGRGGDALDRCRCGPATRLRTEIEVVGARHRTRARTLAWCGRGRWPLTSATGGHAVDGELSGPGETLGLGEAFSLIKTRIGVAPWSPYDRNRTDPAEGEHRPRRRD